MYKVILADDHMPVLEYLTAKVPWGDLGLQLVKACTSGEEALEACREQSPDLLITDIGMPEKNGLELIEEAKKINPSLRSVILSCHENFQYAQKAVQLNVTDYILKETMRIEQINDTLRSLTLQLDKEKAEKQDRRKWQDVVLRNRSSLRTDFLRSLMDNPIWNDSEWAAKAETLGIPLSSGTPLLPVLCMLDRYQEFEVRFGGRTPLHFAIENALNESVQVEGSVAAALDERHYFILYPYPKTLKRNVFEEIQQDLFSAQGAMIRYLKVSTSFYIGDVCKSVSELKKQLLALSKGSHFRFYAGERQIIAMQPAEPSSEDLFVQYTEALHDFNDAILTQDAEEIRQRVKKWIDRIEAEKYSPESVRAWLLKIVTDIELKFTVMQQFLTNYNAEMLQSAVRSIEKLAHMEEWLTHYLQGKMEKVISLQNQSLRKEIVAARRYVLTHLKEKISMEEMALRLDLNPSHFSRIFKKETGETFVEFVTRSKMERARELLQQSGKTVEEVAEELGFDNSSYFCKLFRGYSGMTPMEFRKRM